MCWGGGELAKGEILVKIKKNWLRGKLKILKGENLAKGRKEVIFFLRHT